MSSSFLLCVLGDGGGVMSKVGMCCNCSRHYTEQGSKSCRKQDLLKKMACLWVLINSVPVFQGEQKKQKSHVGRSAKALFIMTSYQWKNSQSALLFVSTSFFFLAYQISDIGTTGIFFRFHEKAILPCDEHIYPYLQVLLKALTIWRKKWFNRPWKILFTNP